jgi:hypothetical protein
LALALAVPALAAAQGSDGIEVSLPGFNGAYSQPGAAPAPVVYGPLTLRLSSPANALVLEESRLRLRPEAGGGYGAEVYAAFRGQGRLVVDFDLAGSPGRLEDEMTLPRQSRTVAGRLRLAAAEGGWDVTVVELPPSVAVTLRSRLAGQLVDLCSTVGMFLAIDCTAAGAALQRAEIPLPRPGETFFLPADKLAAPDRPRLDAFLARHGGAGRAGS